MSQQFKKVKYMQKAAQLSLASMENKSHVTSTNVPSPGLKTGGRTTVVALVEDISIGVYGFCVSDCCSLAMGIKISDMAAWGDMKMAHQLADQNEFFVLKASKWFPEEDRNPVISDDGIWLSSAIESLCRLASFDFCAILQVNALCKDGDNPDHCVAIVDKQLIDPESNIRLELCVESFMALKITKFMDGRQFV